MPDKTLAPRQIVNPPPVNYSETDQGLFVGQFERTLPAASVQVLDSVEVVGRGPLRRHGEYLSESFISEQEAEKWRKKRGHWRAAIERLVSPTSQLTSPALWITDNWSCGYYHWMMEAIARLEFASRSYDLSDLTLLLPYKYRRHRYMAESLQPFGLRAVRFLKRFERICCSELVLPSHLALSGTHDRAIVEDMRTRFLHYLAQPSQATSTQVPASDTNTGSRIYISRRLAALRKIRNEKEISSVLQNHGFEEFLAEEHSWATQMQVVAGASHLVANHGGGLANIFMMKPGSPVLEIRSDTGYMPGCFYQLAAAAQLPYYYLLAPLVSHKDTAHRTDVDVDPAALDRVLHEMTSAGGNAMASEAA